MGNIVGQRVLERKLRLRQIFRFIEKSGPFDLVFVPGFVSNLDGQCSAACSWRT
jgi:hypothetical protein